MKKLVVAIGDLHGHYPALKTLLDRLHKQYAIFCDSPRDRLRPDVRLVFTGDYIDRGRHALAIIERLQRLTAQNSGQVITLMGNHELMALEAFDHAKELSQNASARGLFAAYEMGTTHGGNGGTAFIREFGATTLPAFQSYVDRMARDGDIGGWMRALKPSHRAHIAGKTVLFLHGDLPEDLRDQRRLTRHLLWMDQHRKRPTDEVGGSRAKWGNRTLTDFFWDRTFGRLEHAPQAKIDALCRRVGVDYIVTGHTQHRSITAYGKRIFDIDVGMYRGHPPQALVFTVDGVVGVGADGQEQSFLRFGPPAGRRARGREEQEHRMPARTLTDAELKRLLNAFLLRKGATPAQAKKLVKIVFAEVERGKKAGAILKRMGIDLGL